MTTNEGEPMTDDTETLAAIIHTHMKRVRDRGDYIVGPASDEAAEAILASDWLAARLAAARGQAKAEALAPIRALADALAADLKEDVVEDSWDRGWHVGTRSALNRLRAALPAEPDEHGIQHPTREQRTSGSTESAERGDCWLCKHPVRGSQCAKCGCLAHYPPWHEVTPPAEPEGSDR